MAASPHKVRRHIQRRILSLWLPSFGTDCLGQRRAKMSSKSAIRPLATLIELHGRQVLLSLSQSAHASGLTPLMPAADARAMVPELDLHPAAPGAEAAARDRLVDWCRRYTPWVGIDPAHGAGDGAAGPAFGELGLWLDISGCAHLFGGEAALLTDLQTRLSTLGFAHRLAIADSAGAAWAMARFAHSKGVDPQIIASGQQAALLAPLPMAALRLPAAVVSGLGLSGLRRIGQLYDLPTAPLRARFGAQIVRRLAQALGDEDEPLTPSQPIAPHRVRLSFPEPIALRQDIEAASYRLLCRLATRLEREQSGARRLRLLFFGVDNTVRTITIGVGRPRRDSDGLLQLFMPHFDRLDPAFGFDMVIVEALTVEILTAKTTALAIGPGKADDTADHDPAETVNDLIDRLSNRLGRTAVHRLAPFASHLPEHAETAAASTTDADWTGPETGLPNTAGNRPLRLLTPPEVIETTALLPDHPPVRFRWRGVSYSIRRAIGPERLAPEWWHRSDCTPALDNNLTRDYFQVEDDTGRRYWLYRLGLTERGEAPRWYLHGLFA